MKLENDKLFSFKIKDRKCEELGVLIAEGEDWIFIRSLFTDYMIDGYVLLNKNYIARITRDDKTIFTEKVLIASDKLTTSLSILEIPLSSDLLFEYLERKQTVFQIDNKDEEKCWIGKILDSTSKSIFLTPLAPEGEWNKGYYTFRRNNIRIISLDTDYINSLLKYNETLK